MSFFVSFILTTKKYFADEDCLKYDALKSLPDFSAYIFVLYRENKNPI